MIPKGKVASYGQVAALAGMPSHARYVGRTLGQLPPKTRLPWHRVVNASLRVTDRPGAERQIKRLQAEGIELIGSRVPRGYHWQPGSDD